MAYEKVTYQPAPVLMGCLEPQVVRAAEAGPRPIEEMTACAGSV
jgi:hypothetical protein